MDAVSSSAEATQQEKAVPGETGRPPSIVITAATNLMQLPKVIKSVIKCDYFKRPTNSNSHFVALSLTPFL
jgi:hypothetical protein